MNCLIYARVSTGAQADRQLSIPAQLAAMRQYASQHGWLIVEEFLEAGASGRTADRPELVRMMARCRQEPPITFVLVHKIDRLARNLADHLAIRSYLQREGVKLVSVCESLDDSLSGQLTERILAALAEFYSGNLGLEVRKGLAERVRQGGWPHLQPVGYRRGAPDLHGYRAIEPDPATAEYIRGAFELMATGRYRTVEIAAWLRRQRIPSSTESARRLLGNPFYCGRLRWKRQMFAGNHPPLISTELFDQVQEQLQLRRHVKRSGRTLPLLHGIAVCAACGTILGSEEHKGRTYYRCRRSFKIPKCRARYPSATVVHASLFNLYERLSCSLALRQKLLQFLKQRHASEQRRREWDRQIVAAEAIRRQTRNERLVQALADGTLDPDVYRKLTNDDRSGAMINRNQSRPQTLLTRVALASTIWDLHAQLCLEDQRELAKLLFERVAIDQSGVAVFELRKAAA